MKLKNVGVLLLFIGVTFGQNYELNYANALFSKAAYDGLAKETEGNFVFSPLSLQSILYLTLIGADDATAYEIITGTQLSSDPVLSNTNERDSGYRQDIKYKMENILLDYIKNSSKLSNLNKKYGIFVDAITLNDNFTELADELSVDIQFLHLSDKTPATVNRWVSLYTRDTVKKIQNKIDLITAHLINFQREWKIPFTESVEKFYLSSENFIYIPMLTVYGEFSYTHNRHKKFSVIELPFVNDTSMIIAMPDDQDGIRELEEDVSGFIKITPYIKKNITVTIPQKLANPKTLYFDRLLKNLDIKTAFSVNAEFQVSKTPVHIDNVLQTSGIKLHEKTAQFSAASFNEFKRIRRDYYSTDFFANHSFLYVIKHNVFGVLFIGRYIKPE